MTRKTGGGLAQHLQAPRTGARMGSNGNGHHTISSEEGASRTPERRERRIAVEPTPERGEPSPPKSETKKKSVRKKKHATSETGDGGSGGTAPAPRTGGKHRKEGQKRVQKSLHFEVAESANGASDHPVPRPLRALEPLKKLPLRGEGEQPRGNRRDETSVSPLPAARRVGHPRSATPPRSLDDSVEAGHSPGDLEKGRPAVRSVFSERRDGGERRNTKVDQVVDRRAARPPARAVTGGLDESFGESYEDQSF
jgi:hypothetical protein